MRGILKASGKAELETAAIDERIEGGALAQATFNGATPFASRLVVGERTPYSSGMLDWSQCSAVERVPGKVSGAWVFKDTRVPVRALFENIEGGARVEDFLEWFPGVTHEQVLAVLRHAEATLAEPVT